MLLVCLHARAADTTITLQPVKTISGSFSNMFTDNLQNIYLLSATGSQLKKLDSNGDSVAVFNNVVRYGKIYDADVSNPLKVLVYYKDFSTILILDRFLALRTSIDLRKLGITQVKAVSLSYDSNIWLYDEGDGRIKKIDDHNNVLFQSADLRLALNESLSPDNIIDHNGQLYLYDRNEGWLLFDLYGTFIRKLPFTGWQDVRVNDKQLMGRIHNDWVFASPNDVEYHTLRSQFSLAGAIKTEWQRQYLYVLTNEGLTQYQPKP